MSQPILIIMARLPGAPGLATFRRRLRDEVFSAGGSGGLMAVRKAITGPRVVTEDIRAQQKPNDLSQRAKEAPRLAPS